MPTTLPLLITELNSNAAGGDFFKLYNDGATAMDFTASDSTQVLPAAPSAGVGGAFAQPAVSTSLGSPGF